MCVHSLEQKCNNEAVAGVKVDLRPTLQVCSCLSPAFRGCYEEVKVSTRSRTQCNFCLRNVAELELCYYTYVGRAVAAASPMQNFYR